MESTALAVKEDSPQQLPAVSPKETGEVLDAIPDGRLSWDDIDKWLLDPSKKAGRVVPLAECAKAMEALPPLTKAQCEEMKAVKVGEYLLKVFTLADFAQESLTEWINRHIVAVRWLRDHTRHPGRRLPIPGYPDWTELKKGMFPRRHPNYVDTVIREAAAEEARERKEKENPKPKPQPVPEETTSTRHWDEDFSQLPESEITQVVRAALKRVDYDFAHVILGLDYNRRMSLLTSVMKSLGAGDDMTATTRSACAICYKEAKAAAEREEKRRKATAREKARREKHAKRKDSFRNDGKPKAKEGAAEAAPSSNDNRAAGENAGPANPNQEETNG